MKKIRTAFSRPLHGLAALLILGAAVAPALLQTAASAFTQATVRSVTMSSSKPSDTAVTYTVTFTPQTSLANPDVLVDFCDNTPLIGDTCTATAGTDVPNFTSAAASTWTVSTIGSNRGVKLTGTHTFTAGTPVTITITSVTNPSNTGTNGTFYGRILTYASGTAGANTSASPGAGYSDYGGMALSVTDNIVITAKVFETLSFCVFQTACGTAPALTLGDPTTGALSTSSAYVNSNAKYTLATNASAGVSVVMRGKTLCTTTGASCNSGSSAFTIDPMTTTPAVLTTGTEQFGMCADKNGSAALTIAAAYIDSINNCQGITTGVYAGTSKFGLDNTNLIAAGGTTVLTSSGAVPSVTGGFAFLGDVASTTEAGVYSSSLNLVATGTF